MVLFRRVAALMLLAAALVPSAASTGFAQGGAFAQGAAIAATAPAKDAVPEAVTDARDAVAGAAGNPVKDDATKAKAQSAVAVDVRFAGDLARSRMILDLSTKVEMRVFTLADPYRVVVDIPGLEFRLPSEGGRDGRGLITDFRYGNVSPGKARIVLEVREPVAVDKAFVLEAIDDQPARLVVDLVRTDRATFLRSAETQTPARAEAAALAVKPEPVPPGAKGQLPVVVIDPGHGGIDSGAAARGSGETEKTIVLDVALMLRERLEAGGRVRVVMTRTEDVFVPLGERVRIARRSEAVLFLSIHADSLRVRDGLASGASVYTLSEKASDAEAERLAESENKADLIAGVDLGEEPADVADILIDLVQRETKSFSIHFARTLVKELRPTARMHRTPLKSAGFKVLKAPDVPSVLLELGFLSNREELRQITSQAWRTKVTRAIAEGIEEFVATRTMDESVRAPQ
ncbi:N-acetylmuramoyl-L-alanine amidase [Blastochloris viridis]|nr:N-acetylmuramoyl-L-alanine amidase [Blastochloris viridis]ALK08899.1 N-acetylmuramoyl-L-alanine amidase AmiC precursor [Blastochloris viridis]BAR97799.1 N-acetylmuramoyl-L-alanine amidase [Blastochloris viridis]